jgi:hypothetical protein
MTNYITKLIELGEKINQGPWYIECGVSQRSGWALREWKPGAIGRDVLYLDGSKNIGLDAGFDDVEQTQDYIAALSPSKLIPILKAVQEMREALEKAELRFMAIGNNTDEMSMPTAQELVSMCEASAIAAQTALSTFDAAVRE